MSQQFELFHYWRSSCSWRLRWALNIKNISYKSTPVNLLKGEQNEAWFKQKNPSGTVPSLVVGSKVFTESLAAIEWLDETVAHNPLLPSNPDDRARARELAYATAMSIQPIQNLKVMKHVAQDQSKRIAFAHHWISQGLEPLEKKLQPTAGTYSIGGHITIADLCLVPQVYNALRFNVDMTKFPTIMSIYNNCLKTKECESAAPHNQPGAAP